MKRSLGISASFAVKRWPDPEDWAAIVRQELGLRTVQFSFDQFDPRALEESVAAYVYRVRNACARHGLTIHSTFAGLAVYTHNLLMHPLEEGRRDGVHWFEKAFSMTRELGARATGGPYGGLDLPTDRDAGRREETMRAAEEALVRLLGQAPDYGLDAFYWEQTPVSREGPVDAAGTLAHLERIESIRPKDGARFVLCLDVGHAIAPDAPASEKDPYRWLEKLGPYAPMIHLQQTDGRYDRHWPFTEVYNERGIIDADRVLEAIRSSGENDPLLLIEVGHAFEEEDEKVLDDLRETVRYWKDAIAREGISEGEKE
ncbi:sugar phosphate isomerase/epimerase family protein [Cohnella hongkongensis]|uniref:Sugar phosphate isomerase/epimerase family protein n=1 Tax=Cohnella hongkongensis TaxID=178337 RepID=A0ABV9FCY7_9BACL